MIRRLTSGPEALGARAGVHVRQVGGLVSPVPETHAVVPRQVGAGLGVGQNVVGGDGVGRVGQRHVNQFRTGLSQGLDCDSHRGLDLGVHAVHEVFTRHAKLQSLHAAVQDTGIVGYRGRAGSRVAPVVAGNCV